LNIEPWIETVSGKKFHFLEPAEDEIDIDDIAYALANQCRFNGHCDRYYSVAEHSVFVSSLLPKELQLAGLLHDAAEAYLSDIPSPIKQFLPQFRDMEANVMLAIVKKFGIPNDVVSEALIKKADLQQLRTEALVMLPSKGAEWTITKNITEDGVRPIGYPPNMAYTFFMKAYQYLTNTEPRIQLV
jgi:hypothetical protein